MKIQNLSLLALNAMFDLDQGQMEARLRLADELALICPESDRNARPAIGLREIHKMVHLFQISKLVSSPIPDGNYYGWFRDQLDNIVGLLRQIELDSATAEHLLQFCISLFDTFGERGVASFDGMHDHRDVLAFAA